MKYDYILFENNLDGFENHFIDINIIANLLTKIHFSIKTTNKFFTVKSNEKHSSKRS